MRKRGGARPCVHDVRGSCWSTSSEACFKGGRHKPFIEPNVRAQFIPYDCHKEVVDVLRRRLLAALATSVLALTLGATASAVPAAAATVRAVPAAATVSAAPLAASMALGTNFALSGFCDSGGGRMLCSIDNPGRPEPYTIKWY